MATISDKPDPTSPKEEAKSRILDTIEDEDELLFGTMNSDFADVLADRIQVAVTDGVGQLPLLSDTSKANALVKTVEQSYMQNVDKIEAYGSRNIFTIRHHKPRRRQRILQACLMDLKVEEKDQGEESPASPANNSIVEKVYPTKDEIPTTEVARALQQDLANLKERLEAARSRRNELLAKQKSLQAAEKVSKAAIESLVPTGDVHGPVAKAVQGGQSIQELSREGKQLIKELDDSKRERSDDEDECNEFRRTQNAKKKRKSLEEEYQRDRKVLDTHDVNSLQTLRGMLIQKK